jgi:NAD+ diphosphatase
MRQVGIASRAMQLAEWARTHRHCGCCGTPMQRQPGERAMLCPRAASPRTRDRAGDDGAGPARRSILLGRAPRFVQGVYSALAGFVEAGESLEECVHREVLEEVGSR